MDRRKKIIALAFLISMFLAAFEGIVVTTAAPVIVASLHNFELLSLIFSLYLLTSAISTPIYGKLADLYGRKSMFIIGISIFVVGSLCCGLSQTMTQLVIFRAIQGIGAGSILTIGFTMIGDIFSLEERSVIQGAISSVWGIAGLCGPLIGGFLIDYLSWHWIFFVNIPFGLLCIYILAKHVKEKPPTKKPTIDYVGATLLSVAIGTFLYASMIFEYSLLTSCILVLVSIISLIWFYWQEKRVAEPIVPLFILDKGSIIVNIITFIVSFVLIAATVYLPLYLQSVLGYSAMMAGLIMITTSVSWFLSSISLARLMRRFAANRIVMVSTLILLAGTYLLTTLTPDSPVWYVSVFMFIMGFGFSGIINTLTFIVQDGVPYHLRGASVGLNMLTRGIAQTVGVTVLGAFINYTTNKLIAIQNLGNLTMQDYYAGVAGEAHELLRLDLFTALNEIQWILVVSSLICLVLSYFCPLYKQVNEE